MKGDTLVNGMCMHAHGLEECLHAVASKIGWYENLPATDPTKRRGRAFGCCLGKHQPCPLQPVPMPNSSYLKTGVRLNIGGQEIGQGAHTAALQIAAESLQINPDQISLDVQNDTLTHAYEWQTVASPNHLEYGKCHFISGDRCPSAVAGKGCEFMGRISGTR